MDSNEHYLSKSEKSAYQVTLKSCTFIVMPDRRLSSRSCVSDLHLHFVCSATISGAGGQGIFCWITIEILAEGRLDFTPFLLNYSTIKVMYVVGRGEKPNPHALQLQNM